MWPGLWARDGQTGSWPEQSRLSITYSFQKATDFCDDAFRPRKDSGQSSSAATPSWAAFGHIVFRLPTFPFLGRRTEEYGLSDRQSTDSSDRAIDSRAVLVRTNDRRTC